MNFSDENALKLAVKRFCVNKLICHVFTIGIYKCILYIFFATKSICLDEASLKSFIIDYFVTDH